MCQQMVRDFCLLFLAVRYNPLTKFQVNERWVKGYAIETAFVTFLFCCWLKQPEAWGDHSRGTATPVLHCQILGFLPWEIKLYLVKDTIIFCLKMFLLCEIKPNPSTGPWQTVYSGPSWWNTKPDYCSLDHWHLLLSLVSRLQLSLSQFTFSRTGLNSTYLCGLETRNNLLSDCEIFHLLTVSVIGLNLVPKSLFLYSADYFPTMFQSSCSK